jgi:hypothetical protein
MVETVYLITSIIFFLITELMPFLPTRSHGILHALMNVAQDVLNLYKKDEGNALSQ